MSSQPSLKRILFINDTIVLIIIKAQIHTSYKYAILGLQGYNTWPAGRMRPQEARMRPTRPRGNCVYFGLA